MAIHDILVTQGVRKDEKSQGHWVARVKEYRKSVDFPVEVGKVIESLELRTKLSGGGSIKFAISFDGGVTFYTFKAPTGFEVIDISSIETFAQNGIQSNISNLDYVALNKLCGDKIRFAYLLVKPTLTDICKLKAVKITYAD